METLVKTSALRCSILPLPPVAVNGVSTTKTRLPRFFSSSSKPLSISSPSLPLHRRRTPFFMASASTQTVSPGEIESETAIYQLIQTHQKAAARLPPDEEVRTLLDRSVRGTLSTFSQKYQNYPSASMVDFACDADGSPILAISSLAVHTKDLLANPKCSLLVARDPEDRSDLVITLHGDAILIPDKERDAVRTTYLKRHPNAFWVDFGDFQFMRIEPKVVRYVAGIATALQGSGEFDGENYKGAKIDPISQFSIPVTIHMNRDHAEDTKAIVQHSTKFQVDSAHMMDLDSYGFNVKASYQGITFKVRIPFPRRAEDRKDVKTLIVEMLQSAKAST